MRAEAWRWVGLGALVLLAGVFGYLNSGETVALHLGLLVLYQIRLVTLIFVAFLLGMAAMFLLGLGHDLRVRRRLRELERQAPPPAQPHPWALEPPPDTPP